MREICSAFCSRFLVELEKDEEMRRDEEELRFSLNTLYIAQHKWRVCSRNSPMYSSGETIIGSRVSRPQQNRYHEEKERGSPASQFNGLEGSGLAKRTWIARQTLYV